MKEDDSKLKFWKDKVRDSALYQTSIRDGDIVIVGTDGLFDNLFTDEILNIIDSVKLTKKDESEEDSESPTLSRKHFTKHNAQKLAKALVKEAERKSKSKLSLTPFAKKFNKVNLKQENGVLKWKGGKPDDICVVVGFIKSS